MTMTALDRTLVHLYLLIPTLSNVNEQSDMSKALSTIVQILKKNERLEPGWKPEHALDR